MNNKENINANNQGYPNPNQNNFQNPPYYQQQQPVVMMQPVMMAAPLIFGNNPQSCTCPNCKNNIVTRIIHETGTGTWVIAGAICFFGGWLGCQFIPFCLDGCKDTKHFCPNCNNYLGVKRMM